MCVFFLEGVGGGWGAREGGWWWLDGGFFVVGVLASAEVVSTGYREWHDMLLGGTWN